MKMQVASFYIMRIIKGATYSYGLYYDQEFWRYRSEFDGF